MASEYHRGDMDIHEQVSTFNFFIGLTKWGSLAVAALVLLLTVWFCTPAGFLGALVSTAILTAIGIVVLREKKSGH
jgi:hypothetical protein